MHRSLLALLLPSLAMGQGIVLESFPNTVPMARSLAAMAYDETSERVILFGGIPGIAFGGSTDPLWGTWQWDGVDWLQFPIAQPQQRAGHCLSRDGMGGLLLFGGYTKNAAGSVVGQSDTHRFLAGQWTDVTSPGPAPRSLAAMVATDQGVILFGGNAFPLPGLLGDTWRWNGTWTQLTPSVSPAARYGHAMTFDPVRNVVVLFGGVGHGDTWEFDGATWLQRTPAHNPPARGAAGLVYLTGVQKSLLTGGSGFRLIGGPHSDAWAWDGNDWNQQSLNVPAPALSQASYAFDEARSVMVTFGGVGNSALGSRDQTFEYADSPSTYTPFGNGCAGPNGQVPLLAGVTGEIPRLGTSSRLRVSNLPASLTVPIFVLGTSNTFETGPPPHPLPLDLGIFGWPGCQQLVSHEDMILNATISGHADHTITVPLAFNLLSFTFYAQVIVLYVPSGVAVSNAIEAVVGT
tara:strand:+ start:1779 stop:3164 length:1386 start_codon:yes stop_codon:yes gene_type:complete